MLKKILKWIVIAAVIFVVLVLALLFTVNAKKEKYDQIAIPYLEKVVPELTTWDIDVAKSHFAPEALETASPEQLEKMFRWLSKLGALESMSEPQFQNVRSGATLRQGASTTVDYVIPAEFENGAAIISVSLLVTDTSFEVYNFRLNSEALLE